MSEREQLLTPVGRLVQGSLYKPNTTDAEGRPLLYKNGANIGQPKKEYYFALAIPKGTERHWSETPWGAIIWAVGHKAFPNGQTKSDKFAWKIKDGDSTIPNSKGRAPVECEGFAGHWVVSFNSGFAPKIYNENGTIELVEADFVKLGDWIQVAGTVAGNDSQQQPGVFINHNMVAYRTKGDRIIGGLDPTGVGFGEAPLPAGVAALPAVAGFGDTPPAAPAYAPPVAPAYTSPTPPPTAQAAPPPYHAVLTPPAPIAPVPPPAAPIAPARVMLPAANGASYEQLIGAGWTDALLVQHGLMQP